ncbi:hypothetical protein D8B26_005639 [Coccidioides posadasii str. Silveira]|uniref:Uncharacterized protein n=1 Tax=Coccidioides posadasii (strain RMSCC 757 / Silveira) TaxID=443226 RepID=E9D448_COCPS|nr:conserved hypothetical protein [Coccidioides posadasii str. Silveira]QVM10987.1 hypothetical protein D8B26_005639 [Coccidioides posadasii str. Silveira]
METFGEELVSLGELFSHETLKARDRDNCKYTPRSAGSVQRPQRSEGLLELVRFFTDHNTPFPEDNCMDLGSGSVSDSWASKGLHTAKRWKSHEDLAGQREWQKPGVKWKKDRSKHSTSSSAPDEKPPPPISKDIKVPDMLPVPAARSKCHATSMWTPPTLELPPTPSSSEFSPATENREYKHTKADDLDTTRKEAQGRLSAEPKLEERNIEIGNSSAVQKPCPPLPGETSEGLQVKLSQHHSNSFSNNHDSPRKESECVSKIREVPSRMSEPHKRDGICVAGSHQAHLDTAALLPVSQKSPYIDVQYLPRRTSSKRNHPREQTDTGYLSRPLSPEDLISCFQKPPNVNTPTSDTETSPPLVRLQTKKRPIHQPAPLILSPDFQNESFMETLPPTPATPSCTMAESQTKFAPSYANIPRAPLPPTPSEPSPRSKGTGSKKARKLASKASSLWPPRLNLYPSRERVTKTDIMSPWRGNAFAQLSSLPSSPTVPLDPSAKLQELERRASEAQNLPSRGNDTMTTTSSVSDSTIENKANEDIATKDGESSANPSPKRQSEATTITARLTSPDLRKHPGEPPKIPLPASPPKFRNQSSSPNKGSVDKLEFAASQRQPQVPATPTVDDKNSERILSPKTPNSTKAGHSEATIHRHSESSSYNTRAAKVHIPRSSWDMVDIGITSRPVTPSLPSSDDEKGVYAYCGSASRSRKSRRRHDNDTQSPDRCIMSPISRKKDRDGQGSDNHLITSRPSTRGSFGSSSPRAESLLVQQLQEKIVILERQNKMLHAALSAALDIGGTYDMNLSRNTNFTHTEATPAGVGSGGRLPMGNHVSPSTDTGTFNVGTAECH